MKEYEHQSIFSLWWRVKLNFRDRYRNCHFGVKQNHYPSRWIHIKAPVLFPNQGVLTKFHFSMKFPHLEKLVNLMKDLKYEHQSTFPLWGRVKHNFRARYRKPNVYSKNSSHYQVFSSNSQKLSFWCKQKVITHPDGFV